MLLEESKWVGDTIIKNIESNDLVLNLGSSSLFARTELQPHMEKYIFHPLMSNGINVIHSDIKNDTGVDLIGDITDPVFIEKLSSLNFKMVLCCNLLEHLEDRSTILDSLNEIIPLNGLLLVTVPYQYPFHLDPIDTMFRPNVDELIRLFPNLDLVIGEVIIAQRQVLKNGQLIYHNNYFEQMKDDPKLLIFNVVRILMPFYKFKMWQILFNDLRAMFRPYSATCVLLKKR
jgi:hypothetical protein